MQRNIKFRILAILLSSFGYLFPMGASAQSLCDALTASATYTPNANGTWTVVATLNGNLNPMPQAAYWTFGPTTPNGGTATIQGGNVVTYIAQYPGVLDICANVPNGAGATCNTCTVITIPSNPNCNGQINFQQTVNSNATTTIQAYLAANGTAVLNSVWSINGNGSFPANPNGVFQETFAPGTTNTICATAPNCPPVCTTFTNFHK